MPTGKSPSRHAYLVIGTAVLVACLGLTLIDLAVGYTEDFLDMPAAANRVFVSPFWRNAPFWLTIPLMTPGVILLSRRLRLDAEGWGWRLPVHLLAAGAFSAIVLLASRPFYALHRGEPFWSHRLSITTVRYSSTLFATYWCIVASYYVYRYYHESKTSGLQAALLRESLATEQLRLLRAQLNPHFLFNTLQTVSALAMRQENEAVVDTIGRLGALLRSVLEEHGPEVPLQMESTFVTDYLELERLRFSDRLAFATDISEEALGALVPSMILHPLVENAVVHAVSSSTRPVEIRVSACREGHRLRLSVQDNGPGFSPAGFRDGIGLRNTRARLEQMYGRDHGFAIERLAPHGAVISITLPFRPLPAAGV